MHTRIISNNYDHTCIDSGIAGGIIRVCCNIESDMLHAGKAARTADCCTESDFNCNLFIRRPFGIDFRIRSNGLVDLGAGSSGICA